MWWSSLPQPPKKKLGCFHRGTGKMAANPNLLFHFTQVLKPLFQVFHFEASEEFLEYISEGALSI